MLSYNRLLFPLMFLFFLTACEEEAADVNDPIATFTPLTGIRTGVEYVLPLDLVYENYYFPNSAEEPVPEIIFKTLDIPEWLEMTKAQVNGDRYQLRGTPQLSDIGTTTIHFTVGNGIRSNEYSFDIEVIENASPFEFVPVPAGEYLHRYIDANHRQEEDVEIIDYDFEIMKYEVTNAEYVDYLNEALDWGEVYLDTAILYQNGFRMGIFGYHPGDEIMDEFVDKVLFVLQDAAAIHLNGDRFMVDDGLENFPVVYVTWHGAECFSYHYGLRIPYQTEWEKAARGMRGGDYGPNIHNAVNLDNYFNARDSGDPWDDGPSPVGYYNGQNGTREGASAYGAYDITGNVAEWNLHYGALRSFSGPKKQPTSGGHFMNRVGPFTENSDAAQLFCWYPTWYEYDDASDRIGFRCILK